MTKRIDLHMHSLFSDGELLPSELARRALKLNHEAIAITDHVDWSNVETIPELHKKCVSCDKKLLECTKKSRKPEWHLCHESGW